MKAAQDTRRNIEAPRHSTYMSPEGDNTFTSYYGIACYFKSRTGVAHYGSATVYPNGAIDLQADGKAGRTGPSNTLLVSSIQSPYITACPRCLRDGKDSIEWEDVDLVYIPPEREELASDLIDDGRGLRARGGLVYFD